MAYTNLGGSSGDTVGVDVSGTKSVVDQIHQVIDDLRKQVDKVDHSAQDAANGWKGDASQKFHDAVNAWSQESIELNKKLTMFNQAIEDGSSHLQNMDQH
ncbi:WXG100 family type VII secretion target [Nocardia sp. NBC_01499]|uniref:WXG100 family type VII secretion target n=1 Tax=Nocardia sp. NBC_01499 TaxID=2903597 RepID=UPI00386F400D